MGEVVAALQTLLQYLAVSTEAIPVLLLHPLPRPRCFWFDCGMALLDPLGGTLEAAVAPFSSPHPVQ